MQKRLLPIICLKVIVLTTGSYGNAQTHQEPLKILEPLLDKEWTGTMNGMEITWSMTPILNGQAIRKTLSVPSLHFTSETTFYWDIHHEKVAFLRITMQGHIIQGTITREDNVLILQGVSTKPDARFEFTNTIEIRSDGTLIDQYINDDGSVGHHIVYTAKKKKL